MVSLRIAAIGVSWLILIMAGAYGLIVVTAPAPSYANSEPSLTLNAAGATLAYPLLSLIAAKYTQNHPNVLINYQAEGSLFGVREFTLKHVDFAATYPPLTVSQSRAAPNALHVPESISSVAIAYDVPGVPGGLNLTGDLIARIFLYQITSWSDPAIQSLNQNVRLPDKTIVTIHNAEPEGTTLVFTTYLSLVNGDWRSQVGSGTQVPWPGPYVATPTDAGVSSLVKSTTGSIGYMELSYALQGGLTYASIQNPEGRFVAPSGSSTAAAATHLNSNLPAGNDDWSNVNLLNEPGPSAYPLVTFTYLLVYKELSIVPSMDMQKAQAVVDFFWYVVHDGQTLGPALGYVPLPQNIVSIDEASIKSVTFYGQTLYNGP